ncbi:MAG: cysteine-rich CWC family protein [Burkholderiales bacterium]
MTTNVCERCDAEFSCGVRDTQPCWCATDFPNVLYGDLGDACFCPSCVDEAINSKKLTSENRF